MVRKKKVDLCTECSSSTTPGIQAARLGHEKCLILAYRELGVFNERDNFGATPIHYAARYGHITCLKWLVDNSGISTNAMSQVSPDAVLRKGCVRGEGRNPTYVSCMNIL